MPTVAGMKSKLKQAVLSAAGRLSPPRKEACITMLQAALHLVRGTAPMPALSTTELWVRPLPKPGTAGGRPERQARDPAERAAVRAGWLLVDAYERLTVQGAEKVFGHELAAWTSYAKSTVSNLKPWQERHKLSVYENDHNRRRFRRTMDFVRPGECVFDVGFGRGYLAGLLLRDRNLAGYHGIDIVPGNLDAVRAMQEANGLTDAEVDIGLGNVYELTRAQVAASGATIVICCEVLEHLHDPERALRTLADALPNGVDLLFSVPLHGRLEQVWGHLTVFDVARLKAMVEAAGLYVHHVEPVANVWTMVVASRSPAASRRVRESTFRPAVNVSVPLSCGRDFIDIAPPEFESPTSTCTLEPAKGGVLCEVVAPSGSVEFPVQGLTALRVNFGQRDLAEVTQIEVNVYRARTRVGRWTWVPRRADLVGRKQRRIALRPGESTSTFRAVEFSDTCSADRVELRVKVGPGHSADFSLRAAYLPGNEEPARAS